MGYGLRQCTKGEDNPSPCDKVPVDRSGIQMTRRLGLSSIGGCDDIGGIMAVVCVITTSSVTVRIADLNAVLQCRL